LTGKVHVPFGTKGTHFGEYRTQNTFGGPKKNQKEHTFGNTGKGLIIRFYIRKYLLFKFFKFFKSRTCKYNETGEDRYGDKSEICESGCEPFFIFGTKIFFGRGRYLDFLKRLSIYSDFIIRKKLLFNHGRIPDRLNLGLICILEAKGGENKVRLSVACS
jgi:hypothetical protein